MTTRANVARHSVSGFSNSQIPNIKLSADLRAAFPDMKGLMTANLWRMRQFAPVLRGEGPGVRGSSPMDLKIGKFKPEYAGKSRFYCAALEEQVRLPHENPSIGLVLCKTADKSQVRLALTAAATKIGIATYQTALPDQRLIQRRLEQLPQPPENDE